MPGLFSTRRRTPFSPQPQPQDDGNPPVPGAALQQRYQQPRIAPSPMTPGQRLGMQPGFMRTPGAPSYPQPQAPGQREQPGQMFGFEQQPGLYSVKDPVESFFNLGRSDQSVQDDFNQQHQPQGGGMFGRPEMTDQQVSEYGRQMQPERFQSNDRLIAQNNRAIGGIGNLDSNQGYSPDVLDQNAMAVHTIRNTRPDAQVGGITNNFIDREKRFASGFNKIGGQPNGTPMFQDPAEFDRDGFRHPPMFSVKDNIPDEAARRQSVIDRMHQAAHGGPAYEPAGRIQSIGPTGDLAARLSANNATRAQEFSQRKAAWQQTPQGQMAGLRQQLQAGPRLPGENAYGQQSRNMNTIHTNMFSQQQQALLAQQQQQQKLQQAAVLAGAATPEALAAAQAAFGGQGQGGTGIPASAPNEDQMHAIVGQVPQNLSQQQARQMALKHNFTPEHLDKYILDNQPGWFEGAVARKLKEQRVANADRLRSALAGPRNKFTPSNEPDGSSVMGSW